MTKIKIEELKVGQIFEISYENEKLITREQGNHSSDSYSEQRYLEYTPCKAGDDWFMLNTYQIPNAYSNSDNDIQRFLETLTEKPEYIINHSYNYYYCFKVKLTQDILDLFDYQYDLADYRVVPKQEVVKYSYDDTQTHVRLWREHNYPNGINLVKKTAVYDNNYLIEAMAQEISKYIKLPERIFCLQSDIEGFIKDGIDPNHTIIKEYQKLSGLLERQREEVKKLAETFEWINERGYLKRAKREQLFSEYEED